MPDDVLELYLETLGTGIPRLADPALHGEALLAACTLCAQKSDTFPIILDLRETWIPRQYLSNGGVVL